MDDGSIATALFDRLDREECLNLRTGDYRRRMNIQAGPWARIAAVSLLCACLGVGLQAASARATVAQADALDNQARGLYTQITGQVAPDNLARAARQLGTTDGETGQFLDLSEQLFNVMAAHPDIRIERLSFEARENRLRLRLIYPNFEAAGLLEQTVAESGATFTPGGVREQNGQFIGDAALSLGAGS